MFFFGGFAVFGVLFWLLLVMVFGFGETWYFVIVGLLPVGVACCGFCTARLGLVTLGWLFGDFVILGCFCGRVRLFGFDLFWLAGFGVYCLRWCWFVCFECSGLCCLILLFGVLLV